MRGSVATGSAGSAIRVRSTCFSPCRRTTTPLFARPPSAALGRAGFSAAITTIEGTLRDRAPEIRGAAVRALARLEPARDLSPYVADAEASVRRAALAAIGESSGAGESTLLRALQDEDAETRSVAVTALANRRSVVSIAGLVEAIDDASPTVGQAAVESLGHVAEQEDVLTVIRALTAAPISARRCSRTPGNPWRPRCRAGAVSDAAPRRLEKPGRGGSSTRPDRQPPIGLGPDRRSGGYR